MEALLDGHRLTEPVLSPDGQKIAFSAMKSFAQSGESPASTVRIVSVDGSTLLATDGPTDAHPHWSPDNTQLAFVSDRGSPGVMGLYVLTVDSGHVRAIDGVDGSIEAIIWSPDGRSLLVIARDDVVTALQRDPVVRRPATMCMWRRLHWVDLETGRSTAIGLSGHSVWEIDWDGGDLCAAVVSRDPSENGWYKSFIGAIHLPTGDVQELHAPNWQVGSPRLAPNRKLIAFVEGICSDRGRVSGVVKIVDFPSLGVSIGPVREAASLAPRLEVSSLGWTGEGELWYSGREGMRAMCGLLSLNGVHHELWNGEAALRDVSASGDGRTLVGSKETLCDPAEIAMLKVASPHAGWRALTDLNSSLRSLALPQVERLEWTAPDGLDLEGLLILPRGQDDGERPPLVVIIHGGPTAAWSYAFPCGAGHAALLADAGYAVLLPNPRGSSGRGQRFAQAVVGDLGGAELGDTLAGIDACVAAGHANDDRVGIMGASHGGFMAAWAVTQTRRFRAGVAIACVSDYLSLHYTSNIGALDDILFIDPDRVAAYLDRSPIAHIDKCTTPMLIVHGEQDRCCPPSQAEELYGGLVETGTQAELVIYPREGHGYVEREHQIDLWRRIETWYDAHLALNA